MLAKSKSAKFFSLVRKYITIISFCANLLAIALLFFSARAWVAMPTQYMLIPYLGLVFPFILALNILFLIWWIILRKWKFIIIQLLAFVCLWAPISTYYPIHLRTKHIPKNSFKVLSYNVRSFNWLTGDSARNNPIFDYILNHDADIICLQEFVVTEKFNKKGLISEKEFNEIFKDYPYSSIVRLGNLKSNNKYGLACYSKYPITKSVRLPFSHNMYNGSALHKLEINGKTATLVNNHLASNRITTEDRKLYYKFFEAKDKETLDKVAHNIYNRLGVAFKSREEEAHVIRKYVEEENTDATLICGDFNDTPISYAYHTIKGDMIDAFANTGVGAGITYNENLFFFRIDYIMHTDNLESYNCQVGSVKYSDHYPIWTYLQFVDNH